VGDYIAKKGSYRTLANKAGIDPSILRRWVNNYYEFGVDGLKKRRTQQVYTVEFKLNAIELYESTEMSYRELANSLNMNNPSLIANWRRAYHERGLDGLSARKGRPPKVSKKKSQINQIKDSSETNQLSEAKIKELEQRITDLEIENKFLKGLRRRVAQKSQARKEEIVTEITRLHDEKYALKDILSVLKFPKSTYFYWKNKDEEIDKDADLKEEMKDIRETHKDYGYRRMRAELLSRGYKVSKNKVQRLMKIMGIQVTSYTRKTRKYNSYKGTIGEIAPNRINRRFDSTIPYQKITTDTTEFKYYYADDSGNYQTGKLYLDPYMDLFNREIISFKITHQPNGQSMLEGLQAAIEASKLCPYRRTFHSDQGWAYQMKSYTRLLKDHRIFQSMSRKGNCLDNSPMENFFSLLKQEVYYGRTYHSFEELAQAIEDFIIYYNGERIKEKLDFRSPIEFRLHHASFAA
ncbi:IS3 family transposase, partial [Aerococcus sp. Group 1]